MPASGDGPASGIAASGEPPSDLLEDLLRNLPPGDAPFSYRTRSGWSVVGARLGTGPGAEGALLLTAAPGVPPGPEWRDALGDLAALARHLSGHGAEPSAASGLPGRDRGLTALAARVEAGRNLPRKGGFGVIAVGVDDLAGLNERHGWDLTDRFLESVTSQIAAALPEGAFMSRLGGFGRGNLLILTPLGYTSVTVRSLVESLRRLTESPIVLDSLSLPFSLSLGWGVFRTDGADGAALLRHVETALAEAREAGGGRERRASEEVTRRRLLAASLERDLVTAVERHELFLKWMPVVSTGTRRTVAREALLRWNRPGTGEIPPELFIRCAERMNMIETLDGWALRRACAEAAGWPEPLRVCANISPAWLASGRLARLVAEGLSAAGLPPGRLQIEISERHLTGQEEETFREMARLRSLGVRLALDDFGAGAASLERLRAWPLDQVKLDRGFLTRFEESPRSADILRSVIQLAHALDMSVCAKGVETERQMAFLDALGCEEVQGYLLGPPGTLVSGAPLSGPSLSGADSA